MRMQLEPIFEESFCAYYRLARSSFWKGLSSKFNKIMILSRLFSRHYSFGFVYYLESRDSPVGFVQKDDICPGN